MSGWKHDDGRGLRAADQQRAELEEWSARVQEVTQAAIGHRLGCVRCIANDRLRVDLSLRCPVSQALHRRMFRVWCLADPILRGGLLRSVLATEARKQARPPEIVLAAARWLVICRLRGL